MVASSEIENLTDSYSSPSRFRALSPAIQRAMQQSQQQAMELAVSALMNRQSGNASEEADNSDAMRTQALQVLRARHQAENTGLTGASEAPVNVAQNLTRGETSDVASAGAPKNMVAAGPRTASSSPAGGRQIPQYGLEAGQLPQGLTPRMALGMIGLGVPMDKISAVAGIVAPQYQTDPVTGMQYVVMPNGKVHPIGQGIPQTYDLDLGGIKLKGGWERGPQGINQKIFTPNGGGPSPSSSTAEVEGDGAPMMPKSGSVNDWIDYAGRVNAWRESLKEGQNKLVGGLGEQVNDQIKRGLAARNVINELNMMESAYSAKGNAVPGGPFADQLLGLKQLVNQFIGLPEAELKGLTAAEAVKKISTGLAFKTVRDLTARGTQMEVAMAFKANPGLAMTDLGAKYLIKIQRQLAEQDEALGMRAAGTQNLRSWPKDVAKYYKSNPLVSPFDDRTPLTPESFNRDIAMLTQEWEKSGRPSTTTGLGNSPLSSNSRKGPRGMPAPTIEYYDPNSGNYSTTPQK